jgi:hypothetical protein
MSNQTYIDVNRRDVATFIASKLAPMAVPTMQLRNDLANIQIDHVVLIENYNEIPSVRFKLDIQEGMGVELMVRLVEFATNPTGYMRNLLENLQGIQHSALQRRNGRQAEVSRMFQQMGGNR